MSDPRPIAVVTGAASGIGREFAVRLARSGYLVHAIDVDSAGLESLADALEPSAVSIEIGDVAHAETWARTREQLTRRDVALAVLAAGRLLAGRLDHATPHQIEHQVQVNLTGVLLGAQALAPLLIASVHSPMSTPLPRGILNVASIFASVAPPGFAAYSATKAGVIAATEALRGELARDGLTATAIAPGIVPTRLFAAADYADPQMESVVRDRVEQAELSAEDVVTQALEAYRRGRVVAPIGRRASRFYWLKRWFPRLVAKRVASEAERALPGRD